jgi:transketolase
MPSPYCPGPALISNAQRDLAVEAREILQKQGIPTAVVSIPCRLLFEHQDAAYKKTVLGTSRARVAVEAAVELGWERYTKFDINAEAVVRAAHETLAEVAAL